ncbi:hypothetical protein [Ilumatobacter sp.]|uniref:hypothetical protein n=1 Tax=Ilumatobacter sp. TaxID=1967498 RepID=UPI003B5204C3
MSSRSSGGAPADGARAQRPLRVHRVHGLDVSSQIELPGLGRSVGEPASAADVVVAIHDGPATAADPEGSVIARDETPGRTMAITASGGRWHVAAEGITVVVDATAGGPTTLRVAHRPDAAGTVGWFVGGVGLAIAAMSRSLTVLHGTVVEVDGSGTLLVAPSGHGKSVTAAAAVAGGARLVAEDSVRVERGESGWVAHPGPRILRLRRTPGEVRRSFPGLDVGASSDGRVTVDATMLPPIDATEVTGSLEPPGRRDPIAIDRIAFVRLDPDADAASWLEVDPAIALMTLLGQIRVPGVVDPALLDDHFTAVSALASSAQVGVARLPWHGDLPDLIEPVKVVLGDAERDRRENYS